MATFITLTQGFTTLVDDADVPALSAYRWYYNGYAVGSVNGKAIPMHRFLLNAPRGLSVDHINGYKLDNRRANLRLVTKQENTWNSRPSTSIKDREHLSRAITMNALLESIKDTPPEPIKKRMYLTGDAALSFAELCATLRSYGLYGTQHNLRDNVLNVYERFMDGDMTSDEAGVELGLLRHTAVEWIEQAALTHGAAEVA